MNLGLRLKAGMLRFQPVGHGNVVRVHPGQIPTTRTARGHIARRGPPLVGWQQLNSNPFVVKGLREGKGIVCGAIVHHQQLKVFKALGQDGLYRFKQMGGGIIGGHCHSDFWRGRTHLPSPLTCLYMGASSPRNRATSPVLQP